MDKVFPPLTRLAASLPQTVPFVGPEAIERRTGQPFRARLGANENLFGPSPRALAAIAASAASTWRYGDPENHDLRTALAAKHGVAVESIAVGEGIDGLLGLVARLFIAPGTPVVTSLGGYPTFNFHVTGFGGRLVGVPYRDDREDLDGLLAAVRREQAAVIYLANPDNPMGTWWPAAAIETFIAALPPTTLLLLDEAYGEMAPPGTLPSLDPSQPNVMRLRTFSKAYGLAGLRCGYAIGAPDLIGAFDRVRNHFGVNRTVQQAALAALDDDPYLNQTLHRIAQARVRIAAIAAQHGLNAVPSATNFVTIDCGRDGAFALLVLEHLARAGIFVRKPMAPHLDRCIRITTAPDDVLALLGAAFPGALQAAGI